MTECIASLRARLDDIRDERHFPAHMLSAHDEMLAVLDSMEAALETLAFIESGMSMTAEKRAARWPEWHKRTQEAYARFDRECAPQAPSWRPRSSGMVDCQQTAQHHWVYLPLIREALTGEQVPA